MQNDNSHYNSGTYRRLTLKGLMCLIVTCNEFYYNRKCQYNYEHRCEIQLHKNVLFVNSFASSNTKQNLSPTKPILHVSNIFSSTF